MPEETIARLRASGLFPSLADEQLRGLAGTLVRLSYRAGATIVRQGEDAAYVYLVASGEVAVARDGVVARRGTGAHFGEEALLRGTQHGATVVAGTAVTLYALEGADFRAISADC